MSSVLGVTALVLGNVQGQGDFEVRGRVQGDIVLDGRVLVAAGGLVLGTIEALQITVSGTVRGDLIAEDGVEISGSGQVEGNVSSPRVAIEAGAKVRGHLRTGEESPVAVRGTRDLAALGQRLLEVEQPAVESPPPYDPVVILPPDFAPTALASAGLASAGLASAGLPAGTLASGASSGQADLADARGTDRKRRRRRRRGGDRANGGETASSEGPSEDAVAEPRERGEKRAAIDGGSSRSPSRKEASRNEIIPPQRPTRPSGPLSAEPTAKVRPDGDAAPERGRRSKPLPTFVKGARGHLRS